MKLTPHGEASFLDLLQATFGQDSLCNFNQFQSLLGFKHSHRAFHNLALPESMMKTRKPWQTSTWGWWMIVGCSHPPLVTFICLQLGKWKHPAILQHSVRCLGGCTVESSMIFQQELIQESQVGGDFLKFYCDDLCASLDKHGQELQEDSWKSQCELMTCEGGREPLYHFKGDWSRMKIFHSPCPCV